MLSGYTESTDPCADHDRQVSRARQGALASANTYSTVQCKTYDTQYRTYLPGEDVCSTWTQQSRRIPSSLVG